MPRSTREQLREAILPGMIVMWGNLTAPSGWLKCDGAAVSRTTYKALFGVVGTSFGAGDASTTFNVPDFEGASSTTQRVPAGVITGGSMGTTTASALSNAATVQGGTIQVLFIIKF